MTTEETPVIDNTEFDNLKTSNQSLLAKNSELLDELKQVKSSLNDLGGLDQLKELVTQSTQSKQKELEENNSVDQLKEHFNSQIEQERTKNKELINSIVQNQIDTQLRSAVTKAKGSYTLLEHKLKEQVTGEYENGKVKLSLKDANGMPIMVDGKDATLSDLVNQFRSNEDYARAFDAVANMTGSDTPTGGHTTITNQPETLTEITELYKTNPQKAMEIMKAKGYA